MRAYRPMCSSSLWGYLSFPLRPLPRISFRLSSARFIRLLFLLIARCHHITLFLFMLERVGRMFFVRINSSSYLISWRSSPGLIATADLFYTGLDTSDSKPSTILSAPRPLYGCAWKGSSNNRISLLSGESGLEPGVLQNLSDGDARLYIAVKHQSN